MPNLSWYWHRLRAMSPPEIAQHVQKRWRQSADAHGFHPERTLSLPDSSAFPILPKAADAPEILRSALQRDGKAILAGRWTVFGHLDIQVDDPPKWHCDYLAGKEVATNASAFRLDHRALPDGADIKLIWELSRWNQLVRLAMAAYVLDDPRAGDKCLAWLEDWVKHNPPFQGWNWTSALEVGLRLVQFSWIDALLSRSRRREEADQLIELDQPHPVPAGPMESRLAALRQVILPPHVWYASRYRSFGSSANNHLLGELAGLIVATARWPVLAQDGAGLDELQAQWEKEVLAQFAEDGGNKEQALNYHLFSWEFSWQARAALLQAGRAIAPAVQRRLEEAAVFFAAIQVERESWDYGDSDNGFVTPFFARDADATMEWWKWMRRKFGGEAIGFWWGEPPAWPVSPGWIPEIRSFHFAQAGAYIARVGSWTVRWDLSPLGYLATAAHGHLDALHVSIWLKGVALIVDPGTGAYYGNAPLRNWLASRAAHNGPCPESIDWPRRLGPFLWSKPHATPSLVKGLATLPLGGSQICRLLEISDDEREWRVEDSCVTPGGTGAAFVVRWQFAPGSWVKKLSERKFVLHRAEVALEIEADPQWATVELIEPETGTEEGENPAVSAMQSMEGVVSPSFRTIIRAPFLKLTAPASAKPGKFCALFRNPSM